MIISKQLEEGVTKKNKGRYVTMCDAMGQNIGIRIAVVGPKEIFHIPLYLLSLHIFFVIVALLI